MQKYHHAPAHIRPIFRAPMLDISNIQPVLSLQQPGATFEALKLPSAPMTARAAFATVDSFDFGQCPHHHKLKAITGKYSNCTECGAFISNEGSYAVREESKKSRVEISPSILLENMVRKQHINRKYTPELQVKEIASRKKLVDWLCEVGESAHVSAEYIHKAVVYLDVIMAENTIAESDLQSLGIVCLLLAAKTGEKDHQVSQVRTLFQHKMKIEKSEIRKYEMQVLSLLNWDLQCVTAMDFLQIFTHQGILFNGDRTHLGKPASQKLALTLHQYAEFFADMCLQEYKILLAADPLYLAAGIIGAARKMLKLEKVWSPELFSMTSVRFEEISALVDEILKTYNKMFGKPQRIVVGNKENLAPKTARLGYNSNTIPATTVVAFSVGGNSRNNFGLPFGGGSSTARCV